MDHFKGYFPETYLESRAWFRDQLASVREVYPDAESQHRPLKSDPALTTDWMIGPSSADRGLIISTGLHGVEGYSGTAVLKYFIEHYLPKIDPEETGLLLVHALNPWGMAQRRRTNPSNVDLNRNFRFEVATSIDNPLFPALQPWLQPERTLGSFWLESLRFYLISVWNILRYGVANVREATLKGQVDYPRAPYFGGVIQQPEVEVAMALVTGMIRAKRQVVHIDVHSGYGPISRMALLNSPLEPVGPDEWKDRFAYPHIVRTDPEQFYTIQGDWNDALYRFTQREVPDHLYFGTAFEFGTMGDSLPAQMRSLRAMIFENQVAHYGARSLKTENAVAREFRALFDPPSKTWRQEALRAVDQALGGILDWFGVMQGAD